MLTLPLSLPTSTLQLTAASQPADAVEFPHRSRNVSFGSVELHDWVVAKWQIRGSATVISKLKLKRLRRRLFALLFTDLLLLMRYRVPRSRAST